MNGFAPFDYNAAVNAGTANALNTANFIGAAQKMRDEQESRKTNNALAGFRAKAIGGEQGALQQLFALDPNAGKAVQDFMNNSDASARETMKFAQEQIGKAANASQDAQSWDAAMSNLAAQGVRQATNLVGKFSPETRQHAITMAGLTVDALQEVYDATSPTGTRFVERKDAIGKPGKPTGSGKSGSEDDADGDLKGYQYSEVARAIARYFPEDSLYDMNGNFIGFRKKATRAPQINQAITRAQRIKKNNPGMVIGEAVDRALVESGLIQMQKRSAQPPEDERQPIQYKEGMTAKNPVTGERIIYRNGSWEPIK